MTLLTRSNRLKKNRVITKTSRRAVMSELPEVFKGANPALLERFKKHHDSNPEIYVKFAKLAEQIFATGRPKYSASAIFHKIRWDHDISTRGATFKIDNDYVSIYARLLIYHRPKFDGFFELRKLRSN